MLMSCREQGINKFLQVFDFMGKSKAARFLCKGEKFLKIKHFAISGKLAHKVIHTKCVELYRTK